METNLTFRQQLIFMMAERSVHKYGLHELTDGTIKEIKYIADKLSEDLPETNTGITLDTGLYECGFNYVGLWRNDIMTIGDLIKHSPEDLMKMQNIGKKTVMHIENFLKLHNLKLKGR